MVLNDLLLLATPFVCLPPCLRNVVKKLRVDINLYDGPKTRSKKLKSAHSISFIKQSLALRNSQCKIGSWEKLYRLTNHSTASQCSDQSGQTIWKNLQTNFKPKFTLCQCISYFSELSNFLWKNGINVGIWKWMSDESILFCSIFKSMNKMISNLFFVYTLNFVGWFS